ncbi:hypothetical protein AVEN_13286-1 [Araneus ventricosus]|uniref:Uncharacterized protein n=1 Tax=Araneus ventricosus TaxID=182803 RepID=A0A4Y2EY18_ARAVE|nr:hypothetical protein AVEN_13286-1 [Araneus ventricosus]
MHMKKCTAGRVTSAFASDHAKTPSLVSTVTLGSSPIHMALIPANGQKMNHRTMFRLSSRDVTATIRYSTLCRIFGWPDTKHRIIAGL